MKVLRGYMDLPGKEDKNRFFCMTWTWVGMATGESRLRMVGWRKNRETLLKLETLGS